MLKFQFPKLFTMLCFPCSICANSGADGNECITCPAYSWQNNVDEEKFRTEIEQYITNNVGKKKTQLEESDDKLRNAYAFIEWLSHQFAERRSDVSDLCDEFMNTKKIPVESSIEHRFITARIPHTDITVEYDTFTTELGYMRTTAAVQQWDQCIDHEYKD